MSKTARDIVHEAFKGKVDLAGAPYIGHWDRVYESVYNAHSNESFIDALEDVAYLHDLLEDCPFFNEQSLRCLFPDIVVDAVVALTRKPEQTYSEYIDQVLDNQLAMIVKRYDLEDNMNITRLKKLDGDDFSRLKKYHEAYIRIMAIWPGAEYKV